MNEANPSGRHLGTVLVACQLALIALLVVLGARAVLRGDVSRAALALAILGVGLGIWALSTNRPGNFNIRPTPRRGGRLVQQGPYRWIRHPMYTAVIACGLVCAWVSDSIIGWLSLVALASVLAIKANFEERWMLTTHSGYAEYRARTWRFVPGLF